MLQRVKPFGFRWIAAGPKSFRNTRQIAKGKAEQGPEEHDPERNTKHAVSLRWVRLRVYRQAKSKMEHSSSNAIQPAYCTRICTDAVRASIAHNYNRKKDASWQKHKTQAAAKDNKRQKRS